METWRRLEAVVPLLQHNQVDVEEKFGKFAKEGSSIPYPGPSKYPLTPRPRATTLLHELPPTPHDPHTHKEPEPPLDHPPHTQLGPPYSLLLVDRSDSANAFSYGFGPDGGGGVVVFTGFLDTILKSSPPPEPAPEVPQQRPLLSYFTGSTPPAPVPFKPTEEQTAQLAILLAHELSHLILSHHLETLSSGTILIPTMVGMLADVARTLAFPFTMVFGPFVNDALWEISKTGTGEVVKNSEACTTRALEVEADLVSVR